eukprot:CAMPEP_0172447328 /NCGR_PEP_ID=MMETSP1065-20121228/6646_1 /TAXON_ID=265537 /ORGANISM="Amphiprora paludosa, Strain CCMP125" /LENGTH=251 /DNA_ID=CAMNT_0013198593 /DNA_START=188 /DNA_END=943 /DNA_ORIENTATION=-
MTQYILDGDYHIEYYRPWDVHEQRDPRDTLSDALEDVVEGDHFMEEPLCFANGQGLADTVIENHCIDLQEEQESDDENDTDEEDEDEDDNASTESGNEQQQECSDTEDDKSTTNHKRIRRCEAPSCTTPANEIRYLYCLEDVNPSSSSTCNETHNRLYCGDCMDDDLFWAVQFVSTHGIDPSKWEWKWEEWKDYTPLPAEDGDGSKANLDSTITNHNATGTSDCFAVELWSFSPYETEHVMFVGTTKSIGS